MGWIDLDWKEKKHAIGPFELGQFLSETKKPHPWAVETGKRNHPWETDEN